MKCNQCITDHVSTKGVHPAVHVSCGLAQFIHFSGVTRGTAINYRTSLSGSSIRISRPLHVHLAVFCAGAYRLVTVARRFRELKVRRGFRVQRTLYFFLRRLINFRFIRGFRGHRFQAGTDRVCDYFSAQVSATSGHCILAFVRQAITIETGDSAFSSVIHFTQGVRLTPTYAYHRSGNEDEGAFANEDNRGFYQSVRFSFVRATVLRCVSQVIISVYRGIIHRLLSNDLEGKGRILSTSHFFSLSSSAFNCRYSVRTFAYQMSDEDYANESASRCWRVVILGEFFGEIVGAPFVGSMLNFRFKGRFSRVAAPRVSRFTVNGGEESSLCFRYLGFFLISDTVRHFINSPTVRDDRSVRYLRCVQAVNTDGEGVDHRLSQAVRNSSADASAFIQCVFAFSVTVRSHWRREDGLVSIECYAGPSANERAIFCGYGLGSFTVHGTT